jgi:ABC-2 type transport system ATP-binding protein
MTVTNVDDKSAAATLAGESPVVVENLFKSYGTVQAVADVSFSVHRGEVFGLLGPNGAGKTTTVEMIEGLRRPDGGLLRVCGYDPVTQTDQVKQRIGVGLQSTALPDKIRAREALELFASFYARRASSDDLLSMVSLTEKATAYFDTLSGGQKQRLAIALALVNDPEVVILDEPTSGLDPQSRRELHGIIDQLRERDKTVILTTHYIEEAEKLCDRVGIIDHGKIIALATPRELIADSQGHARVELRTASPLDLGRMRQIPFVASISEHQGAYLLKTADAPRTVIELIKLLEAEGGEIVDLHITRPTLEDVFIELTGRRIRE